MTNQHPFLLSTLAVTVMMGASFNAMAQNNANQNAAPTAEQRAVETSSLTQEFVRQAVSLNLFDVEASKLALQRSKHDAVKSLAQKMVDEHGSVAKDIDAAIGNARIDPTVAPTAMLNDEQEELNELRRESDADFDEEYLSALDDTHEDAIELYERYARDGDNAALKAFASKSLASLRAHKAEIDRLEDAF